MPLVTIHRREYALWTPDGRYRCACWTEYLFDPLPAGWASPRYYRSDAEYLHSWTPLAPALVRAPPGSRLEERPTPRGPETWLSYYLDPVGLSAWAIYHLARKGLKGFRLEDKDVAKRRQDEGPTLFDSAIDAPAPEVGAYGPAKRGGWPDFGAYGPADDGPRFARSGEAIDQVEQLRAGIARALGQIRAAIDGGEPARVVTARAILEGLIEAPAGAGEAT